MKNKRLVILRGLLRNLTKPRISSLKFLQNMFCTKVLISSLLFIVLIGEVLFIQESAEWIFKRKTCLEFKNQSKTWSTLRVIELIAFLWTSTNFIQVFYMWCKILESVQIICKSFVCYLKQLLFSPIFLAKLVLS